MGMKKGIPTWGSHRPILEALLEYYNINNALEMGIGLGSTPTFLKYGVELYTWESEEHWIKVVQKYINNYSNKKHKITKIKKNQYGEQIKKDQNFYDIIFIDAHDRIEAINNSFGKTNIIISHDCEEPSYGWINIKHSNEYTLIQIKNIVPWSWVWIKNNYLDKFIKEKLENIKESDYYGNNKYRFEGL